MVSVAAFLDHPTSICVLAESGGDLVGSVLVGWDGWRLSIYRLAVDPTFRREGVARRLVDAAVHHGARSGAVRIDAMVAVDNADAKAFWAAAGFETNPRYVRFERRL